MQSNADPKPREHVDPVVATPAARSKRSMMRSRELPGGLTFGGFVVAELVCTGTLVAAILVADL
ncbi:MAG TPA: hypothetical protein VHF51_05340 [Solirubrobacteraceae bacterium]|nr:hypothetical protein [Solirubrobacteraceae bacterium]